MLCLYGVGVQVIIYKFSSMNKIATIPKISRQDQIEWDIKVTLQSADSIGTSLFLLKIRTSWMHISNMLCFYFGTCRPELWPFRNPSPSWNCHLIRVFLKHSAGQPLLCHGGCPHDSWLLWMLSAQV